MLKPIKQFFYIEDLTKGNDQSNTFRISALRILLVVCLMVFLVFSIHSLTYIATDETHLLTTIVGGVYALLLTGLLIISRLHTKLAAAALIGLMAVSGAALLYKAASPDLILLALFTLYILPTLSHIFFSLKAAIVISFANLVALYFGFQVEHSFIQLSAPPTDFVPLYAHIAAFILLNVALPLVFSRVFNTLIITIESLRKLAARVNHHSALYEEIFEHTGTPTLLCDHKGKILKLNKHALKLFHEQTRSAIEGSRINDWVTSTADSTNRYFWQKNASECALKSNPKTFLEVHRSALTKHGYYVLHLQNVTHLRALAEELESTQQTNSELALLDSLTRMPNHHNFCDLVNTQLQQATEYYTGAMFIIRISQFKLLNKQYGRDQANRVILNFAQKLQASLSEHTITGRLRGVKFACFMPIGQTYLIQRNLHTFIKSVLPAQIRIGDDFLNIDYQVGVSYYQGDSEDGAEELLEQCEMALEYSTSAQRVAFFDQHLETKLIQEHKLGLCLNEAVKNKQIQLWLQPQVVNNGTIRSFEALARWQLKDGTFVSPIVFIKLAEELGLLPKLAENMLRQLVAVLEQWHRESIKTPIAFNLAGQELMSDVFFALLMSLASDHPWLSDMLEIEITETSPVMTHPLIHKRLRTLSQYGFSIAIDDFGTGQASLGQLIDIPANILKIDRRFVAPLPDDQRHLDIVKSTIQLAKSLNMNVIAEGIETREQANLLTGLGCDTLQGYYFGKPCPITDWTANNNEKAKQLRMVY